MPKLTPQQRTERDKAILEALKAGDRSIRQIAKAMGCGNGTVHRVAKAHGIVNGTAKAIKRNTKRNGTPKVGRNTPGVPPEPHTPVRSISDLSIDERMERNTVASSKAVETGITLLDRAKKILLDVGSSADLLKAAAQMYRSATEGMAKSNAMARLNAGLPTSYEKGETKTTGTLSVEQITPEVIQQSASEAFGVHLGRLAENPVPVAEDMDN